MSPQPQSQCLDENSALALLDGNLPSAARAKLEKHLEICDACRELVAEVAKLNADAAGGDGDEVASADTERIPFALATELAPGAIVGPFRIDAAIGSGAFGTVYRATESQTNRVVALKMVTDPTLRARFAREASTLARLDHPAIVRYISHGSVPTAGGMYLAMEWLEGEDLEQRLRRGPLGWEAARKLGIRLSGALAHAHGLGCIHRDISPRNIYLPRGDVESAKLLDFGLVRVGSLTPGLSMESGMAGTLERTGSQALLGTPFYMSPEQVRDPKSVDARSDLFGLGVLLFEAVSGVRPFQGEDLFSVWVRIVDLPAPDLRAIAPIPEPLAILIESMLEKDPNARPRSALDVQHALNLVAPSAESGKGGTAALPPIQPPRTSTNAPPIVQIIQSVAPSQFHSPSTNPSPHLYSQTQRSVMAPATTGMPPPPPSPPVAAAQPKRSSSSLIIAGVSVTAVTIAVSSIAIYASKQNDDSPSTITIKSKAASTTTDVNDHPLVEPPDLPDPIPAQAQAQPASQTTPSKTVDAGKGSKQQRMLPPAHLFCGSDDVETRTGEHFAARPEFKDIEEAVVVAGDCKMTLEDCLIDGPHSVMVMGNGQLTLRRCKVIGTTKLLGEVTLILEGTDLPSAPSTVGKGSKVIRR